MLSLSSFKKLVPITGLPAGTVLQLNGYSNPRYVIVFECDGIYKAINLETFEISGFETWSVMPIAQKQDNRIQTYITGEVLSPSELNDVRLRHAAREHLKDQIKALQEENRQLKLAKGREWLAANKPSDAQAVIIAELIRDECDLQSDYFATSTQRTVYIAWSKHKRDLFSEMRKAAAASGMPELAELGPGCDKWTARIVFTVMVQDHGTWYHAGERSRWHNEHPAKTFTTEAQALSYVAEQSEPHNITMSGGVATFAWSIDRESIEHKEKYSMGAGYYLQAGNRYDSGWRVSKTNIHPDELCIAYAEGRIAKSMRG